MSFAPNYYDAHLIVAGVRILHHKDGRPPTPDDVAELLAISPEKTHVLVSELGRREILHLTESPFDVRIDILDMAAIESLPKEDTDPAMKEELEDFHAKSKEKKKEMNRMFRGGEAEKRRKERVQSLEDQFKVFKPSKGELDSLFGEDEEGEEEDG